MYAAQVGDNEEHPMTISEFGTPARPTSECAGAGDDSMLGSHSPRHVDGGGGGGDDGNQHELNNNDPSVLADRLVRGHGARFSTEFYTRGCHWFPRLLA
jgi:hypothetical protein